MSQVMGPDQTLRLVQLYRDHYSDISRHTQDVEGRKRKMQVWKDITDELNASFNTMFSVEQYKKKLQNVQCTSRQKLQTGRGSSKILRPGKNTRVGPGSRFSAAEAEFIRLFEDHNGAFDSPFRHDSGSDPLDMDPTQIKVEDFLSTLGFNNFNTNIFDTPTNTSGTDSNADEGTENFNKQLLTKLGQLGQQILDQQNAFSALNGLNVQPVTDPIESSQISPATSSSNDPGANSSENSRKRENSTAEAKPMNGHGLGLLSSMASHEPLIIKRRRKAIPVENGHDDGWKSELLEVQKKILENQEKILQNLDSKPMNEPKHESPPPKSEKTEYQEAKLNALLALGNKLDRLCDAVSSLEKTVQSMNGKVNAAPSEEL